MNKSGFTIVLIIILTVVAAFLYRQYTVFRVPVTSTSTSAVLDKTIQETSSVKHSVPLEDIFTGNPVKDGIPSIDDPSYDSIAEADQYLSDDGFGLAVEVNGRHRFYPYQILVWHEIVNETFGDESLLVTYCPLCFTGIVFEREIENEIYEFGTSGKLYNSNLLMYDRTTDSLWSQALGESVVGNLTGTELVLYPSLTITWDEFKKSFSGGSVLSRDTGFERNYTNDPYPGYYTNASIKFPISHKDDRLHPKTIVFGMDLGDGQAAYPIESVESVGVINEEVAGKDVVVFWDDDLQTVRGYFAQIDEQVLTFDKENGILVDRETKSRWNTNGEAFGGELLGSQLELAPLENHFWFSWFTTHPDTKLFNIE